MAASQDPVVSSQMIVISVFCSYTREVLLSCDKFIARIKAATRKAFRGIFTIRGCASVSVAFCLPQRKSELLDANTRL